MSIQPIFDLAEDVPPIFAAWGELAIAAPHRVWRRYSKYVDPETVDYTRSDVGPDLCHYLVPGWSNPDFGDDTGNGPAHVPDMWALVSTHKAHLMVQAVAQTAAHAAAFVEHLEEVLELDR